jgi:nucleotide-binding universal stress UspA family protein
VAYEHLLVVCDGTTEADAAVRSASELAARDHAQLTVVAVAEIERAPRGCGFGTSTWNDVLRDAAAADLERARKVVESPAHFAVLCGDRYRVVAEAARELGCDAIMVGRPRGRLRGILRSDPAKAVRRRTSCAVLEPY